MSADFARDAAAPRDGTRTAPAAGQSYSASGAPRRHPARRALAAIGVAAVLHVVALYFLVVEQSSFTLTSMSGGQPKSVSVTLVAAAPIAPSAPATPPVQVPKARPHVLATHHASSRRIEQQPEPEPQPTSVPQPSKLQQTAAVSSPPVQPAQPDTARSAPAAPESPAALALPKAIDASTLHQLACRIPAPSYPPRAKRLGEGGTVRIDVVIGTDGRVANARVGASSGYPDLDAAARDAVSSGVCEAYREGGVAIAVTAVQPITFNLSN